MVSLFDFYQLRFSVVAFRRYMVSQLLVKSLIRLVMIDWTGVDVFRLSSGKPPGLSLNSVKIRRINLVEELEQSDANNKQPYPKILTSNNHISLVFS